MTSTSNRQATKQHHLSEKTIISCFDKGDYEMNMYSVSFKTLFLQFEYENVRPNIMSSISSDHLMNIPFGQLESFKPGSHMIADDRNGSQNCRFCDLRSCENTHLRSFADPLRTSAIKHRQSQTIAENRTKLYSLRQSVIVAIIWKQFALQSLRTHGSVNFRDFVIVCDHIETRRN